VQAQKKILALKSHFSGNTESWLKIRGVFWRRLTPVMCHKSNSSDTYTVQHYVLMGLDAAMYHDARKSACLLNCGVGMFCMADDDADSAGVQVCSNQMCSPTVSVFHTQGRRK